jgi:hypothetical protein
VDTLPLPPPGCHVQGDRTRHIEPGEALAALGVEETGGARSAGGVVKTPDRRVGQVMRRGIANPPFGGLISLTKVSD